MFGYRGIPRMSPSRRKSASAKTTSGGSHRDGSKSVSPAVTNTIDDKQLWKKKKEKKEKEKKKKRKKKKRNLSLSLFLSLFHLDSNLKSIKWAENISPLWNIECQWEEH